MRFRPLPQELPDETEQIPEKDHRGVIIVVPNTKKQSKSVSPCQRMAKMMSSNCPCEDPMRNSPEGCQCPDELFDKDKLAKGISGAFEVCAEQLSKDEQNDYFELEELLDLQPQSPKDIFLMKSDKTQTTSGFKVQIKTKADEDELSYEEALFLLGDDLDDEFIEPEMGSIGGTWSGTPLSYSLGYNKKTKRGSHDPCSCEDPREFRNLSTCDNPNVICECPNIMPPAVPAPPPQLNPPNAPFDIAGTQPSGPASGIKFTVGGKGSGSKGLSGICCFDMLQDSMAINAVPNSDSTESTYLLYS